MKYIRISEIINSVSLNKVDFKFPIVIVIAFYIVVKYCSYKSVIDKKKKKNFSRNLSMDKQLKIFYLFFLKKN